MSEGKKKNHTGRVILFAILRFAARIINVFIWHYKVKSKYKIKKGESIVILSNHQANLDPIYILMSFNRPITCVATDNLLVGRFNIWFFSKLLGVIPKRKGMTDIKATSKMLSVVQEGGSLLIFPEGNRNYAEFQFYIADNFAHFLKVLKSTVVIFNLRGGTGVNPRWGNKKRKGVFEGEIVKVLKYDEFKDAPDSDLNDFIKQSLRVYDSESGHEYNCKARAEYLERLFYVCPKCHSICSLESEGHHIRCKNCGLEVEFTKDLHLASEDKDFKFKSLNEWYQFQKQFVKNMPIEIGKEIYRDSNCTLFNANAFEKRIKLDEGDVTITTEYLKIGNTTFPLSEITSVSPISGIKLNFSAGDKSYLIVGHERFNPVKYAHMLNKLDTPIRNNKLDDYFNLD